MCNYNLCKILYAGLLPFNDHTRLNWFYNSPLHLKCNESQFMKSVVLQQATKQEINHQFMHKTDTYR